ncbi:hypothetical protein E3O11_08845 [Cryobacterium levicorallinum]|uniref:Uncharacterized protein n=1 Tax=Cryobacterium levicorallinum TaxID=995038 RepID=A0A4R8VLL1_9MICO|nr:hypothetical protein E3O11_08845 [Cryobacterium levicorallinum]TFD63369.1 hypothetical protein E3T41_05785 [Cryobacterium sp. Hh38]
MLIQRKYGMPWPGRGCRGWPPAAATDTPLEVGQHVQQLFQRLIDQGQGGNVCDDTCAGRRRRTVPRRVASPR